MKKILCFYAFDSGRDIQALAPILYNLANYQNCKIIHAYIFESYKVVCIKPDLVLLSNAIGSREHFNLLKQCYERNIPVFSLTAEGNLKDEYYKSDICWGWNIDKIIYQYKYCFWSSRSMKLFSDHHPNIDNSKFALTGGSGFDLYRMIKNYSQVKNSLTDLTAGYEAVIVYAGWAFGKVYSLPDLNHLAKVYPGDRLPEYVEWAKDTRQNIEDILRSAIKAFPNYLFVFKKHPREHSKALIDEPMNEMSPLENYDNVYYLRGSEYTLIDLLQIASVWTCFESTTVMESWLSGIPTINIIPNDDRRMSTYVATGSTISIDSNSFIENLKHQIKLKKSNSFSISDIQIGIIKNAIGFYDGLNHLRIIKEILKLLEEESKPRYKLSGVDLRNMILFNSMKFLNSVPIIRNIGVVKKHSFFEDSFSIEKLQQELGDLYEIIESFYEHIDPKKELAKV